MGNYGKVSWLNELPLWSIVKGQDQSDVTIYSDTHRIHRKLRSDYSAINAFVAENAR